MRTRMHEMYKALRADNAIRLHTDFVKNQKQALAEKELRHDRGLADTNAAFGAFKNRAHSGDAAFFDGLVVLLTPYNNNNNAADKNSNSSNNNNNNNNINQQQLEQLSKKQLAALVSVAAKCVPHFVAHDDGNGIMTSL